MGTDRYIHHKKKFEVLLSPDLKINKILIQSLNSPNPQICNIHQSVHKKAQGTHDIPTHMK